MKKIEASLKKDKRRAKKRRKIVPGLYKEKNLLELHTF